MRFFSIVLLSSLFLTRGSELNEWPIVGVFTQPSSYSDEPCNGDCFYIAASYVKYIESAGARVVPIPYEAETEELDYLFESMNGFLYTGGGADMSDAAKYLYSKAVQANDEGDFFPVWGTCLGFEWLMIATSGNDSILDSVFDSENYSIPLDFTAAVSQSRLFSHAPPEVVKTLATENVTMNNHMAGIAVDHFYATPELSTFYNVLSTNTDRAGWEFVSTVEAYNYPIYGTQWHPEKNIFEWGETNGMPYEAINHSPEAVRVAQYTASFFVQETRKNFHAFASADEEDAYLIYNYQPTKTGPDFVQTYFFHFD